MDTAGKTETCNAPRPATGMAGFGVGALRTDAASALLAMLLFMLPLYRTRVLEDSFNTPKLALLLVMAVFTTVALMARQRTFAMRLRWYPAPWLLITLAAWQAVSVLWADSKPLAVDGTVYFAGFAVLCWLFTRGPCSIAALRGLFNAGSTAAVLTALWALYDDFSGGDPALVARLPDWRGKLAAGLGNSGHIAGMIGMFLPWLVLSFLRSEPTSFSHDEDADNPHRRTVSGRRWWLLLPVIMAAFAALTVTWSVGSTGATLLSLFTWGIVALFFAPKNLLRWRRLGWLIAGGLAVMAFYFVQNPLNPHKPNLWAQAFSSQRWEDGWPTRLAIWKTTWQIVDQAPMVGVGTGNFTYAYTQQVVPSLMADPALRPYAGAFTNDAHNDYLQLWAEGGVVALALWVAVLAVFVTQTGRLLRERTDPDRALMLLAAGAGLTVFALDGLMSFPMRLPAHFAMATFFLAVPGVLMRLPQSLGGTREISGAAVPRVYGRRLRAGGVGILLTLAACVWHLGHRVVAEYYLKAGRSAADAAIVNTGTGLAPAWQVCDSLYRDTLEAVATGAAEDDWRRGLVQMNYLAEEPNMIQARMLFEKSQASDRWYANASSRLGQLLLFQGDFPASIKVSQRTLKTLEAYEIHERLGAASFFAGDMKRAREHWSICLTRRPDSSGFYSALLEQAKP